MALSSVAVAGSGQILCPLALNVRRGGPLVGRPLELAAIEQEMSAARQGRLACLLLEGEPGIGKTRLLLAAQEQAAAAGFAVMAATADEELRAPFLVARSILGCGTALELAEQAGAVATVERALNAMIGRDDPGLAGLPSDTRVVRIYDLAAVALRELAAKRPIAILLDDLQWADEDSLRLLRYVVRSDADTPLLLVIAVRPEETAAMNELVTLVADLDRLGYLRRLRLQRFTQGQSAELLQRVLRGGVAPTAAATLHAQSEGVPFILEALAGAYREAGMVQQIDGVWNLAKSAHRLLPGAVQTLIQRRVTKLPEPTRSLLGEAAVVGRSFSLRDLAAIRQQLEGSRPDVGLLAELAAPAVAAGLLHQQAEDSPADYSFSHDQIRAFSLARLNPSRRRQVHRAIVEMLSGAGEPAPESLALLVHHARESGEPELSGRFAIDAARSARERSAPDELLRVVELGLPAVTDPRDRLTLLLLRDDAFSVLRRSVDRLEALAEVAALADALGDRSLQLQVMLRRSAALRAMNEHARAAETARRVREQAGALGEKRLELEACLELGQACLRDALGETYVPILSEIDPAGAQEAYTAAAELAAGLGDDRSRAAAIRELGVVGMAHVRAVIVEVEQSGSIPVDLFAEERLARPYLTALGSFQEALEIYERLGDRHGVMSSILGLAYATWGADFRVFGVVRRLEALRRLVGRAKGLATESERDLAELQLLYGVHAFARDTGYPDLALARGVEAYDKARGMGERLVEFLAALGMGELHLQFRDVAAVREWLDRAAVSASEAPTPLKARLLEISRGRLAACVADAEAMLGHFERALEQALPQGGTAARCEVLAQLALQGAQLLEHGADPAGLGQRVEARGRDAIELAGSLPSHALWRAQARAALAGLALRRDERGAALEQARAALGELQALPEDELHLDILLICARAVMAAGERSEREELHARIELLVGSVAERILDEAVRDRWFEASPQAELAALVGGVEDARAAFRRSPLIVAQEHLAEPGPPLQVSDSERQLLRLMTEGRTDEEIARHVGVPVADVARQVTEVIARMGAPSRAAATAFIFLQRLV